MATWQLSVEEIVAIVQPTRQAGSLADAFITGVASIQHGQKGDLSFLENAHYVSQMVDKSYEKFLSTTNASVVLVPADFPSAQPKAGQQFLFVKKPSLAFAQVCGRIERLLWPKPSAGIHPSAVIDREAKIHPSAHIGPQCVIGPRAEIHKGVVLHAGCIVRAQAIVSAETEVKSRVVIGEDCVIGERCILHSGTVIGSDGYGYVFDNGRHMKVPQIGNVILENDVEIGANTTVDRARFGSTRIGEGTKIDNLVQIAHNVVVGKNCLIVAQAAIGGGAVIEDYVIIGGQAGVGGHIRVGSQVKIAAQAGVNASLEPKITVTGNPAQEFNKAYRIEALKRKLPELFKRVKNLEAHCEIETEEK